MDEFLAEGSGTKDAGNCAFVHHGNQGLTYTEVFYGNPDGESAAWMAVDLMKFYRSMKQRKFRETFTCREH